VVAVVDVLATDFMAAVDARVEVGWAMGMIV